MNKIKFLIVILLIVFGTPHYVNAQDHNSVINDSTFVNLKEYSSAFIYDMKYATENNFLQAKVYDCAECYLRLKTVKSLIAANADFQKLGYTIKIFDCFRPLSIQKRMWNIVSNPEYVADPAKGSIHNRGGAVDIALVDKNGNELDFGTAFDFFGVEAGHSYNKLPKKILNNRKLLKKIMEQNGFKALKSEWWHYDFTGALGDAVSNFNWPCP
ncbi:M15 family metallopeptidase [Flavobacterium sp.]|uniref:M15 family metallopeptidase n=1 Tax=Flavobacterium sp. TaxID=239 RepID=UPI0026106E22|nr:M15 family metallopeptidase [Flavobacterium sp.]MDD3005186.1 M15 family metallopeptidase [Flavobacterium sp.]